MKFYTLLSAVLLLSPLAHATSQPDLPLAPAQIRLGDARRCLLTHAQVNAFKAEHLSKTAREEQAFWHASQGARGQIAGLDVYATFKYPPAGTLADLNQLDPELATEIAEALIGCPKSYFR